MLVVDDSPLVRRTVERMLARQGHRVRTATSGEEAFDLCLREPFDLVVSDVTMGALSGFQLCRLLRSDPATEDLPVVLLTAAGDPRSRFWGRNAGADEYIAKDAMREELVPAVERLLEGRPLVQQAPAERPHIEPEPMAKLAEVLDRHLFEAVVASELRKLMAHLDDRRRFIHAALSLAGEIARYAYMVLRLEGPDGFTCAVHARGPWPDIPSQEALAGLGLTERDALSLDMLVSSESELPPGERLPSGEMAVFPIRAGEERLGEMVIFGGRRAIAVADRRTVELVARDLGLLVKSLFLMEQTRKMARTDVLTGLPNRRTVAERLEHEVARAKRTGQPLSVVLCDVDLFKQVNDRFGHGVGDEVLQHVAAALAGSVRQVDLVGRWGGEEFLVVLPETAEAGARVVGERLRAAVAAMPRLQAGPAGVTISSGVSTYVEGENVDRLVDRADEALYRAKQRGRNRVEVAQVKPPPAPEHSGPAGSGSEADR